METVEMKKALLLMLAFSGLAIPQTAKAQSHSATLMWSNSTSNASGSTVTLYKLAGACPSTPPTSITGSGFTLLIAGLTGTTYVDTAVTPGLNYCYFGVTISGTTTSGLSNTASAIIPGSFPPQMLLIVVQ